MTDISKLHVRSRTMKLIRAFSKPNYGFTPLKQETNGNRSHATITSSSFLSLSLFLVRSQLHNSMHPLLQAWRTCGTRNNPMRARVPMGTGNEMVVTVSQPLRRWTAGMHPMMLSVGDCSLGHGDDTGPTEDPP